MIRKMFWQLHDLLDRYDRVRAVQVFGLASLSAILDVAGVASVMPFMSVLANPKIVETNATAARVYSFLGFTDPRRFLFFVGIMVFVTLVVSLICKALATYAQLRFSMMREFSIAARLVSGYLHQPYSWFLNRNSADLGKSVLSEVSQVIYGAVMPMMALITHGVVTVAILGLLVAVDPTLAIVVGGVLGVSYGIVSWITSSYLSRIGVERSRANEQRYRVVSEAFGGVKEVKLGGLETVYVERFSKPARVFATHQASSQAVSQLPRFSLEGIAFGGLVLVVLFLMAGSKGLDTALPVVALYAFAGYRLMPAAQQIYASLAAMRYTVEAVDKLHADVMALAVPISAAGDGLPMPLNNAIVLHDVSYTYPEAHQPALNGISIRIPARQTIGLVGSTGSGKTTTVDLILGLLEPSAGRVEVDGVPITDITRRRWQRAIGYVPQQIYLADDTIAANIAFGLPADSIDLASVERAARIANLHEFVTTLPDGYATSVGERGVRLSGGQRQRIGIARALYHKPQVLLLDEATSALDNLTEQAVMEAVYNLGKQMTVILIAHRLSTVRSADCIYLLRAGRVSASGTFDEIIAADDTFRAMAGQEGLAPALTKV